MLYLEKYWRYRKFEGRFFYSHSTKHLAKRKKWNRINRLRAEDRNVKKKSIPPQNEITMPKPWNHDSNGRSQYLQMIVKLVSKRKKMKICRYEVDTAFLKTLTADYQHRRLPPLVTVKTSSAYQNLAIPIQPSMYNVPCIIYIRVV